MKPYNRNPPPKISANAKVWIKVWMLVILMLINCYICYILYAFNETKKHNDNLVHIFLNDNLVYIFLALCLTQLILGVCFAVFGKKANRLGWLAAVSALLFVIIFVARAVYMTLGAMGMGGAWGRPLRIRGRQLHPELREGSDWTRGLQPDPTGLDEATRHALESLWLHDAQKEHASVPAFSRIAWLLAAVGAPAELMEWAHRAALEEIEHTRLCFALAAGYSGRSHTVEPMPELLLGGLDEKANPLLTLAVESLSDGCQLEDFNADVAAACAEVCQEPVTRAVLEIIAREERTHADFSWALLTWLLERSRDTVQPAIEKALAELNNYPRPSAVSWKKRAIVARANPEKMLKHGRLSDERWGELWDIRLIETRQRVQSLLEQPKELTRSAVG